MEMLTLIERAVLGTTAHAAENLEQIYQHLHASPEAVPLAEAAEAVRSLVKKGLLSPRFVAAHDAAHSDLSWIWKDRFEPTPEGRKALGDDRPDPSSTRSTGRVYAGMYQGRMPDVPFEVFKENRREMSRKSSEDAPDA